MHPQFNFKSHEMDTNRVKRDMPFLQFEPKQIEKDYTYWNDFAQNILKTQLKKNIPNTKIAKNLILFLGDGMSIPTLAATRVYIGGEEKVLSFEKFPYTGLSKTYCANTQVADSACSATAYLSGIKANYGTIGVTANVQLGNCSAESDPKNFVSSIATWAQNSGMNTGMFFYLYLVS